MIKSPAAAATINTIGMDSPQKNVCRIFLNFSDSIQDVLNKNRFITLHTAAWFPF
jgi:hypothetical protein